MEVRENEVLTLRNGAIQQILQQLDRAFLTRHAFDLTFNDPNGQIVQLTFRDHKDFTFTIQQPGTGENNTTQWRTVECPGRYFTSPEIYDHRDFPNAMGSIYAWVDRIIQDLASVKSKRSDNIEQMRRNLEETADALPNPTEPFTETELDAWSEKFDSLIQRLETLESEGQIQKGQVESLKHQLEELKKQGTSIPKRTWLKTAGHKVLDLLDTASKEVIKALAEGAVKALLDRSK
jgi:hypothetical protein